MIHSKPSRMPRTSTPSSWARIVAALMTLLMPGAGPPPTRIDREEAAGAETDRRTERGHLAQAAVAEVPLAG
jgi:hypothetical protein